MADECKLNCFCYICGSLVPQIDRKPQPKRISDELKLAYSLYFKEAFEAGRDHTPDGVCKSCYNVLTNWARRGNSTFAFMKPMKWEIVTEGHIPTNCYACVHYSMYSRLNRKRLKNKTYDDFPNGKTPIQRPSDVDPPTPPSPSMFSGITEETSPTYSADDSADFDFELDDEPPSPLGPRPLTQHELDHLVAKFHLSQQGAEYLATFFKKRKMTAHGINATAYRTRHVEYKQFYTVNADNTFTYCNDIEG